MINGDGDFDSHVVVVTGGASGIGLEVTKWLLQRGAFVSVMDLEKQVGNIPCDLRSSRLTFLPVDLSQEDQVHSAFLKITSLHKRLDGLVSCAGTRMASCRVVDLNWSEWERVLAINLKGVVLCCKGAARIMLHQGFGAIVNVASIASHSPRPGQSAYAASKAAVVQFTRVLALELAEGGVRVNAVCPGTTATPMIEQAKVQDGVELLKERIYGDPRSFRPGIPLRRVADAEDQAASVLFLLSDHAKHITGQTIFVDGGESIV